MFNNTRILLQTFLSKYLTLQICTLNHCFSFIIAEKITKLILDEDSVHRKQLLDHMKPLSNELMLFQLKLELPLVK